MAGSYNKLIIIGNLGRDPETRLLPSGDNVATFSVATTERSKNGDVTTWFRVSAFGKLAETCQQYLHKGSYVYIEGALSQNEYTNREGQVRQSLEVRAREMRMLDKAGERGADSGDSDDAATTYGRRTQGTAPAGALSDMDEIPF
jgi:single-strand DNA-binding protein